MLYPFFRCILPDLSPLVRAGKTQSFLIANRLPRHFITIVDAKPRQNRPWSDPRAPEGLEARTAVGCRLHLAALCDGRHSILVEQWQCFRSWMRESDGDGAGRARRREPCRPPSRKSARIESYIEQERMGRHVIGRRHPP
jgi:hypothetical protein